MKLKIKVTKDILKKSMMCGTQKYNYGNPVTENCAIALAVREIFPEAQVLYTCMIIDDNEEYKAFLPKEAQNFISEFDNLNHFPDERLLMPELEFEIDVPEAYLETVNIDEVVSIINQSQTLELV